MPHIRRPSRNPPAIGFAQSFCSWISQNISTPFQRLPFVNQLKTVSTAITYLAKSINRGVAFTVMCPLSYGFAAGCEAVAPPRRKLALK